MRAIVVAGAVLCAACGPPDRSRDPAGAWTMNLAGCAGVMTLIHHGDTLSGNWSCDTASGTVTGTISTVTGQVALELQPTSAIQPLTLYGGYSDRRIECSAFFVEPDGVQREEFFEATRF